MNRLLLILLSFIPRPLPVGMTAFEKWSARILLQAGNYADPDSMRFALASQLMHLGPQVSSKCDNFFTSSLRKAAVNQVASQVFQDIKKKQQEQALAAKAAEEAKTQAEVTAIPSATSNENQEKVS